MFSSFKKLTDSPTRESSLSKIQYTGNMCLWFLRKCFLLQQVPSGIMTLEEKTSILMTLVIQVLEPIFTKKLAHFNLKIFLEVYALIFANKELGVLIDEYNEALMQRYRSYYPVIWEETVVSYNSNAKNYISWSPNEEEREQLTFYDLVLSHLKSTVPMDNKSLLWQ